MIGLDVFRLLPIFERCLNDELPELEAREREAAREMAIDLTWILRSLLMMFVDLSRERNHERVCCLDKDRS